MVAFVLMMATCRQPAPSDRWVGAEGELDVAIVGGGDEQASRKGEVFATKWRDPETNLSIALPEGWRGWPGVPGDNIRLHLEHEETQAAVRVYRDITTLNGDFVGGDCEWSFNDVGSYSTLKVTGEVLVRSCWPVVPGGQRYDVWIFRENQMDWLVVSSTIGGETARSSYAIAELLSTLRF